jgi:hypothetical protein
MGVHAAKFRTGKGSTTIPQGSTSQAIGGGYGKLLTGNAEDEEIVYAYAKALEVHEILIPENCIEGSISM